MKKLFILIGISILIPIMCYSTDWENHLLIPDCRSYEADWEGPNEEVICAEDFPELELLYPGCCYTIVYYDRWVEEEFEDGSFSEDYEIAIVGIFWEGVNCDNCDKTAIAELFYFNKLEEENSDYSLYARLCGTDGTGVALSEVLQFFTPAKCFNNNNICDDNIIRCCEIVYKITFNGDGDITSKEIYPGSSPDIFPDCTPECTPECDQYPFQYIGSLKCEMPDCDFGIQTENTETISVPLPSFGAQCTVSVEIRFGVKVCPGATYYDYEILDYTVSPYCNYILEQEIYQGILDYLLEDGYYSDELGENTTFNNYRMVNAKCWQFNPNNPNQRIPCEDNIGCCYEQWGVETDENGDVIDSWYIDGGPLDETGFPATILPCGDEFQYCWAMCEEYPYKIEYNYGDNEYLHVRMNQITDSKIIPNPNSGEFSIVLNSIDNGRLTIEIKDVNGTALINKSLLKESQIQVFEVNMKNYSSGTYFYRVFDKNSNIPIFEGKFVLTK